MRLSELYVSVQGEGPNTGKIVQFVRFAGCNMRCPGWPCDTEHAINPAIWQKEAKLVSPEELLQMVQANGPWDLCLTGGEPFMQRTAELQEFVQHAKTLGYKVECFTNGSYEYPQWALSNMQFIMDWKLGGSGESETRVRERRMNAKALKRSDNIKFVVVDEKDMQDAMEVWYDLVINFGCVAQFWIGPAWDRISTQEVIDFVTHNGLPWKINTQLHKYIWQPDARGV